MGTDRWWVDDVFSSQNRNNNLYWWFGFIRHRYVIIRIQALPWPSCGSGSWERGYRTKIQHFKQKLPVLKTNDIKLVKNTCYANSSWSVPCLYSVSVILAIFCFLDPDPQGRAKVTSLNADPWDPPDPCNWYHFLKIGLGTRKLRQSYAVLKRDTKTKA